MNITRKKIIFLSVIVLLLVICIVLGVILFIIRRNIRYESKEICVLKDCIKIADHERNLQSSLESICVQKYCISKNPPDPSQLCLFKKCVSEVERMNLSEIFCVEKSPCLTPPPMSARLEEKKQVCLSELCVLTAFSILTVLDQSVDPCNDFYEFSCGHYFRGKTANDRATKSNKISSRIKEILEYPIIERDSDSLTKAKTVYSACLNSSESESKSVDVLKDLMLSGKIGSWPVIIANWSECDQDLEYQMAMLNAYGVDSFFKLIPEFKGVNNTLYGNVYIATPLIDGICDETFENEDGTLTPFGSKITQKYRDLMNDAFDLLDVLENVTESDIDAILRFDAKFCNATKSSWDKPSFYKEDKIPFQDLIFIAPQINWSRWHHIIFNEIGLNHRLDKTSIFAHNMQSSIEPLVDLLENTSSRTITNYLSWKFAFHHFGFLKPAFRQLILEHQPFFQNKLDFFMDVKSSSHRWSQCVKYVQRLMPIALIPPYSLEIMDIDLQKEIANIISIVKKIFDETFSKTSYLSHSEKTKIKKKIQQLKFRLFYPDNDKRYYNEYYSKIEEFGSTFLEKGMSLRKFHLKKTFEGVLQKKKITDLEYSILIYNPFETSAWSNFKGNAILLSFAALENTGIDIHQPKYLNFGSFGTMIGQLMARGFALENVRPPFNWTIWPKSVDRELDEKTRCFIYQFLENKTLYQNVDIPSVVNNAIADNFGIQQVFKAYKKLISNNGKEKQIPGLNYSDEQLFFIKYAQFWCNTGSGNQNSYQSTKLRVNGALRNIHAFSETFQCHKGKHMNPSTKCKTLWS